MASNRHFNGIAHDIAHHAQSGLSYLHPWLDDACREARLSEAALDLLADRPWPTGFPVSEPLRLATSALQRRFADMVAKAGLSVDDLSEAGLVFIFASPGSAGSPEVRSRLKTEDGRVFAHRLVVTW